MKTTARFLLGVICILTVLFVSGGGAEEAARPGAARVPSMEGYVSRYHPAHLSSGEAWEMAADGGAVVLDVRSEASYNDRHVSGAVNVPPDRVVQYANENLPDKDRVILCYCFCGDTGGDAYVAYKELTELGYTRVFYMDPENEWIYEGTTVADELSHKLVTGEEAKKLFGDGAAILLDVRNKDEYDEKHIDGSLLIPVSELSTRLPELPDKSAVIIVYCRSGNRSRTASDILTAAGYENVYDMQSVENWPEPLVK